MRRSRGDAFRSARQSRSKPDIVIIDISLNGPDGMEMLKNIRITIAAPAGPDSLHAR